MTATISWKKSSTAFNKNLCHLGGEYLQWIASFQEYILFWWDKHKQLLRICELIVSTGFPQALEIMENH